MVISQLKEGRKHFRRSRTELECVKLLYEGMAGFKTSRDTAHILEFLAVEHICDLTKNLFMELSDRQVGLAVNWALFSVEVSDEAAVDVALALELRQPKKANMVFILAVAH